jgi:hypothetical protein
MPTTKITQPTTIPATAPAPSPARTDSRRLGSGYKCTTGKHCRAVPLDVTDAAGAAEARPVDPSSIALTVAVIVREPPLPSCTVAKPPRLEP